MSSDHVAIYFGNKDQLDIEFEFNNYMIKNEKFKFLTCCIDGCGCVIQNNWEGHLQTHKLLKNISLLDRNKINAIICKVYQRSSLDSDILYPNFNGEVIIQGFLFFFFIHKRKNRNH